MKGEECWICGKSKEVTKHHAIPKTYRPKMNQIIPLCKGCHKKLHLDRGETIGPRREIVYFTKMKQIDGKTKIQGNISNGKIIFPDNGESIPIRSGRYYDVLVHQTPNVAFARDIKEYKIG